MRQGFKQLAQRPGPRHAAPRTRHRPRPAAKARQWDPERGGWAARWTSRSVLNLVSLKERKLGERPAGFPDESDQAPDPEAEGGKRGETIP